MVTYLYMYVSLYITQCPIRLSVGWLCFLIQTVKRQVSNARGPMCLLLCGWKTVLVWCWNIPVVHLNGRAFFWLLCLSVSVCLLLVHCFSPNFTCLVSWVGGSYRPTTSNATLISTMFQSSFNDGNKIEMNPMPSSHLLPPPSPWGCMSKQML